MDEAASGVVSHLSGLDRDFINKENPLENWTNALEFQGVFSPYRLCSVQSKDGDQQCLALFNSTGEQMSHRIV